MKKNKVEEYIGRFRKRKKKREIILLHYDLKKIFLKNMAWQRKQDLPREEDIK